MGISIRVTTRAVAVIKSTVPVVLGRLGFAGRRDQRRHDENAKQNSDQQPNQELPHAAAGSASRNEHCGQALNIGRRHVGELQADVEFCRSILA
jgi:hypothetical protein